VLDLKTDTRLTRHRNAISSITVNRPQSDQKTIALSTAMTAAGMHEKIASAGAKSMKRSLACSLEARPSRSIARLWVGLGTHPHCPNRPARVIGRYARYQLIGQRLSD